MASLAVAGRHERVAAADRIRKCHIGFQADQETGGQKLVVTGLEPAKIAPGPGKAVMAVVEVERSGSRNVAPDFPGGHMGLPPTHGRDERQRRIHSSRLTVRGPFLVLGQTAPPLAPAPSWSD